MRLQVWVQGLSRWRARGLGFVLGFVAIFAMPPVYQIYLLVPAFSGLLWLSAAAETRWRAFVVGWWFGAGYFAASLYWVAFALLVEADKFAWMIPFAILGIAFGVGLIGALAAWAVRAFPGSLSTRAVFLAGVWTILEWVRAWLFTGLPWNPVGSVWAVSDAMVQNAWLVGVFGLSLFTVLAAASFGALTQRTADGKRPAKPIVIGALLVLLAGMGFGQYRLATAQRGDVDGVRLRLVQSGIPQADKWKRDLRERNMMTQIDLALAPPHAGEPAPTHVIWAETAAPFFIENSPEWRRLVGASTPKGGLTLLGAPRAFAAEDGSVQVANAMLALDERGRVVDHFDKFHLVPFGEYVPLPDWLPIEKITQGRGAFTPGPGPRTVTLDGLPPVGPLICYEVIFPGEVTESAQRPSWLLNLTNDGWYAHTAGPHQHFVAARLRAVEEGLPTVRVAFTGISAIIDAYGRVEKSLGLGKKGFIDGNLPQKTERVGPFARWGNTVPMALSLVLVLGAVWGAKRRI